MNQKHLPIGQTVMTRGVADWIDNAPNPYLRNSQIFNALYLHASGDWGLVDKEDWATNDEALIHGERVLSVYEIDGTKIWVITERDRSVTTVLFPEEY